MSTRNHPDTSEVDERKPETPQPETGEVVDFVVPFDEVDFEVENLPGPDEFEAIHGYPIHDEADDAPTDE